VCIRYLSDNLEKSSVIISERRKDDLLNAVLLNIALHYVYDTITTFVIDTRYWDWFIMYLN